MVEVYTPNTKTVKSYDLGEEIDVTINGQSVIPILADKIYKSPYSAVRELYNNEVTACKKAIKINPKLKPEIIIKLDTQTRELIIMGVDSLGIDSETFTQILAVMGNSGNNNGEDIGYFGLGFYSFVKVSERIIIISNSLETGEKWGMICKSALKFEKMKTGQYDDLDKTGFKVILNVKNDLDFEQITSKVRQISKLSGIKTTYTIDGDKIDLVQYNNLEDYFKTYYSTYFNEEHPDYSIIYRHIDNDDYELIIGNITGGSNLDKLEECTLLNTPIDLEFPYRSGHNINLINIKSERSFKPTPDRERFEAESEQKILNILEDNEFDRLEILPQLSNISEWYETKLRHFITSINGVNLDIRVKSLNSKGGQWDNTKYVWKSLLEQLPKEKPKAFKYAIKMRTRGFEKLQENNEFGCCVDSYGLTRLKKIGFVDMDAGKKKKSSNGKYDATKKTKNFKFWYRYGVTESLEDNENNIIFKVADVKHNVLKSYCRCGFIYWITERADHDGHDVDELINFINQDYCLFTNEGLKTIRDIIEISENRDISELTNNLGRDEKNHYMRYLMSETDNENLIVKFDGSRNSELLELYMAIKNQTSYLKRYYIDIQDLKYEEWKSTIKDKRLKYIISESYSLSHDDKMRNVLTSIERDLK